MNEIQIYLKTSGSIAELYKDFNLYVGSYQNVLLSVYVPTSLLYQNEQGTYVNSVKTGAITTAPNGTQVTTDSYYLNYVNNVTVNNVEYAVYNQLLPNTFVTYAGTQTVVINVVAIDNTNSESPVVLAVVTSQTAPLVVQQSSYLSQDPVISPTELEVITGQINSLNQSVNSLDQSVNNLNQSVDGLEENKLDKKSGVIAYPQVYGVQNGTQALYNVNDGPVSSPPYESSIIMSTSAGNVYAATPTESSHAANKSYVDDSTQSVIDIIDGINISKTNDLQYQLNVNGQPAGTIDIPKDQFLQSVSYDPEFPFFGKAGNDCQFACKRRRRKKMGLRSDNYQRNGHRNYGF